MLVFLIEQTSKKGGGSPACRQPASRQPPHHAPRPRGVTLEPLPPVLALQPTDDVRVAAHEHARARLAARKGGLERRLQRGVLSCPPTIMANLWWY